MKPVSKGIPRGMHARERSVVTLMEEGWSFIETIIVIAIVLILSASISFVAGKFVSQAKEAGARSDVSVLSLAVENYLIDNGVLPGDFRDLVDAPSDLASWRGPYLSSDVPLDPWGRPYRLVTADSGLLPRNYTFGVRCLGEDGVEGGAASAADVVSWDLRR